MRSADDVAKPNFSGTWRFNPAKSALQISPPDATVFVIEHREPALRVARTHITGGKSDTFTGGCWRGSS
jgi:hypothetical protein